MADSCGRRETSQQRGGSGRKEEEEETKVGGRSLRKCFQDGVHLLCHGGQHKLKLLLRRWWSEEVQRGTEGEGKRGREKGREKKRDKVKCRGKNCRNPPRPGVSENRACESERLLLLLLLL